MNLKQFNDKVREMTDKVIHEKKLDYEDVRIQYTKTGGKHMLWAMNGDEIVAYFDWG